MELLLFVLTRLMLLLLLLALVVGNGLPLRRSHGQISKVTVYFVHDFFLLFFSLFQLPTTNHFHFSF